jgi:chromosome partitioning protein
MKIVAIINQKGGVGKTTSAINIGAGLALLERKTLLIDFDSQANLTYSLNIKAEEIKGSVYELIKGTKTLEECIVERSGMKVIPSSINLAGADIEFSAEIGRENLLKDALAGLDKFDFDYVFIDCPPTLGLLTLNALVAATEVYIPMQTEHLAVQGVGKIVDIIDKVKKKGLNRKLEITGIIPTRYDSRKNLNNETIEEIKKQFGKLVFKSIIRDNIALAEAPSEGKTIFEYRRSSYGAEDYLNLCAEIIERGKNAK